MKDFAAIDFETANNERSSVCSVGIVVVRNGEIVEQVLLAHKARTRILHLLVQPCARPKRRRHTRRSRLPRGMEADRAKDSRSPPRSPQQGVR